MVKQKTALVSGDQGFVARHMIPLLLNAGYDVTGFDVKNPAKHFQHDRYTSLPRLDARDFFRHDNTQYDLVIHLAAVVGGRQKIEGAPLDLAVDLSIDAEMMSWAMRTRPNKLVCFSSSAAYPTHLQQGYPFMHELSENDIDLDSIETPDELYGFSKLSLELLANKARKDGLDVVVVRPFSGYGTDQDLCYPFPSLIERGINRADPLYVWGSGLQTRDWIHIDDVCRGTLAAVEQNIEGPINLCIGRGINFFELAQMICCEVGYSPKVIPLIDKPSGLNYRVGNPTKMLSFYGPKITLEQGISDALKQIERA